MYERVYICNGKEPTWHLFLLHKVPHAHLLAYNLKMGIRYPYNHKVIPISFATCSFGFQPYIDLPEKLKALHNAGFDAVEMAMEDILAYGKVMRGEEPDANDYDTIVEIASHIRSLAKDVNIGMLILKSFTSQAGDEPGAREKGSNKARGWLRVMEALGPTRCWWVNRTLYRLSRLTIGRCGRQVLKRLLVHSVICLRTLRKSLICVRIKTFASHMRTGARRKPGPGKWLGRW
jgi:hypothetical protein